MNSDPVRRRRAMRSARLAAALLAGACLTTGCTQGTRTQVVSSVVETYPSAASENDFADELARRDVVSNDDALHALFLFQGSEQPATFEERLARAQQLGWIDLRFNRPARETMPAAVFAGALARILHLRGGLTYSIASGWTTAANRELRAQGIMPVLSDNQSMTGPQLLSVLRKAEMYQAANQPQEPLGPADHAPEPEAR